MNRLTSKHIQQMGVVAIGITESQEPERAEQLLRKILGLLGKLKINGGADIEEKP
jgi:hypothetical protein